MGCHSRHQTDRWAGSWSPTEESGLGEVAEGMQENPNLPLRKLIGHPRFQGLNGQEINPPGKVGVFQTESRALPPAGSSPEKEHPHPHGTKHDNQLLTLWSPHRRTGHSYIPYAPSIA